MSFSPEQIAALEAPLDRANVKERSQAGRQLSYIEGYMAIKEANRIFGFDAWDRETVELRQLGEPREIDGKVRVAYMARVRISVCAYNDKPVIRDGCGFGSGIDKDLGQAHESALKEAETDAMKRALMTFGNPFGLALYDKKQSEVADTTPYRSAHKAGRATAAAPEPQSATMLAKFIDEARSKPTFQDLKHWYEMPETRQIMDAMGDTEFEVAKQEVIRLRLAFTSGKRAA